MRFGHSAQSSLILGKMRELSWCAKVRPQIPGFFLLILLLLKTSKVEASSLPLQEPQDPQDTVLINFPRKLNSSKPSARHLYLPPEEPDFVLPEVIDNRVRSILLRPTAAPDVDLRAPIPAEPPRYTSVKLADYGKLQKSVDSVRITSMSCKNGDELFFRASVGAKFRESPVVEGAGSDACRVERTNDEYKIDFSGDLFWNCGVQDCSTEAGKFYCLSLRFPAIAGLRLKEDTKVLLRCRTQERTTSHTRRFNVKTLDTSGRMAPRVATGGHRNAFETDVGLYRKTFGSDQLFDAKIQPGGTVILGEEILLRAVVRDGDGWKYARMSDVTVNYVESKRRKRIVNSVWILDSSGCLNPDVREVASREQYRVSPLESYLIFEAFMFDSMRESDELILSVKVTGCLDGSDCVLNCPGGHVRKSRSLEDPLNNTVDLLDDISFRVILPKSSKSREPSNDNQMIIPYILACLLLAAIVALLCTIKVVRSQKVKRSFFN